MAKSKLKNIELVARLGSDSGMPDARGVIWKGVCYKHKLWISDDTTGEYSVYTEDSRGNEIMFHVSTLLPYTQNNR